MPQARYNIRNLKHVRFIHSTGMLMKYSNNTSFLYEAHFECPTAPAYLHTFCLRRELLLPMRSLLSVSITNNETGNSLNAFPWTFIKPFSYTFHTIKVSNLNTSSYVYTEGSKTAQNCIVPCNNNGPPGTWKRAGINVLNSIPDFSLRIANAWARNLFKKWGNGYLLSTNRSSK